MIPGENQIVFNGLADIANEFGCFVLAVDHFGKTIEAGTRGPAAKEDSSDVVPLCSRSCADRRDRDFRWRLVDDRW